MSGYVYLRQLMARPHKEEQPRAAIRPAPPEEDPRYRRARAAYVRLLREGRLRCGDTCPLFAIGQCTTRCW